MLIEVKLTEKEVRFRKIVLQLERLVQLRDC
jgi:hypothetical protein